MAAQVGVDGDGNGLLNRNPSARAPLQGFDVQPARLRVPVIASQIAHLLIPQPVQAQEACEGIAAKCGPGRSQMSHEHCDDFGELIEGERGHVEDRCR